MESDISGWALSHLTHEEWDRVSHKRVHINHMPFFFS